MTNGANPWPIPKRYLEPAALTARARIDPRLSGWASTHSGASGAVLLGETGQGKTLAAAWAASRAQESNKSATWAKWTRADELSRLLSERGASEQIHQLKTARLLVIDELGYERWPELVLEVLGARHDASRPTIFTSGLTEAAIATRYTDATIRRVIEIGNGCIVNCLQVKQ